MQINSQTIATSCFSCSEAFQIMSVCHDAVFADAVFLLLFFLVCLTDLVMESHFNPMFGMKLDFMA